MILRLTSPARRHHLQSGGEYLCHNYGILTGITFHNGSPSIPDPNTAAIAGIQTQASLYPYEYIINALSQTGGSGAPVDPITGQATPVDFTGLGTAAVQNQMSDQMAQTLLDIQQGLGPQYIAQRLQDLQQSDPTGYAARQQLFDQIQAEAAQAPPGQALAQSTQDQILSELNQGATLTPQEQMQVQQGVRGNQVASGIYLGNAPAQAEADAVVQAGDQQQAARQGAAGTFLSSGVSPSDIQYRQTQQDMANLGAFINNQTPESQFGSLTGAQSGAAPTPQTGYSAPTLNEGSAASSGVSNAFDLYNQNFNWSNSQANPFTAGLSAATGAFNTASNLGYSPFSSAATGANPWGAVSTLPQSLTGTPAAGSDLSGLQGGGGYFSADFLSNP